MRKYLCIKKRLLRNKNNKTRRWNGLDKGEGDSTPQATVCKSKSSAPVKHFCWKDKAIFWRQSMYDKTITPQPQLWSFLTFKSVLIKLFSTKTSVRCEMKRWVLSLSFELRDHIWWWRYEKKALWAINKPIDNPTRDAIPPTGQFHEWWFHNKNVQLCFVVCMCKTLSMTEIR